MNDYISRQAVIQLALDGKIISTDIEKRVRDFINELPAADVQPVKRGRWFLRGGNWCCSACNRKTLLTLESNIGGCKEYGTVKTDYCPNCGAKMEMEDKNADSN